LGGWVVSGRLRVWLVRNSKLLSHEPIVVRVALDSGAKQTFGDKGHVFGEPVFVGRPERDREDDGVVLSVVFDSSANRSFLLVLDATSFEEQGRAEAPHHVPFGFHGQFMSD